MSVPQKICHQSVVLLSLLSLNSSAGGLMVLSVFQWFLCLKWMMIQMILLVLGETRPPPPPSPAPPQKATTTKKLYASLHLIDAGRFKAEWEKLYSSADSSSQKWNGLVNLQSAAQWSAFILWDLSICRRRGRAVAVKVFAFTVLLAEQYQK